ncbi:MAG: hypothetical protein AAB131_04610 [Actinomycetota bacterium]
MKKQEEGATDDKYRRPTGPLGPWRLSLSILATAAFTGLPLLRAAATGVGLDMALVRSFGVAFLSWIALGSATRMLAQAEAAADRDSPVAANAGSARAVEGDKSSQSRS